MLKISTRGKDKMGLYRIVFKEFSAKTGVCGYENRVWLNETREIFHQIPLFFQFQTAVFFHEIAIIFRENRIQKPYSPMVQPYGILCMPCPDLAKARKICTQSPFLPPLPS